MIKNTAIIIFCLFSCKSLPINSDGEYYLTGADFSYRVTLNKDSTFVLSQSGLESISKCVGKWHYLSKDTISLDCDPEDNYAKIKSNYLQQRNQKLIVINKNKLKLNGLILKRLN